MRTSTTTHTLLPETDALAKPAWEPPHIRPLGQASEDTDFTKAKLYQSEVLTDLQILHIFPKPARRRN